MTPEERAVHAAYLRREVERTQHEFQIATDIALTESMDIDFDEDAGIVNHESLNAVVDRALARMHAESAYLDARDALDRFER
jgi:hypothetical protein